MLLRVIAKNIRDVFLRHSVDAVPPVRMVLSSRRRWGEFTSQNGGKFH